MNGSTILMLYECMPDQSGSCMSVYQNLSQYCMTVGYKPRDKIIQTFNHPPYKHPIISLHNHQFIHFSVKLQILRFIDILSKMKIMSKRKIQFLIQHQESRIQNPINHHPTDTLQQTFYQRR